MRIVVIDSDISFTSSFSMRCKKVNVFCQVYPQSAAALAEIKKDPDSVDIILLSREQGGDQDGLAVAQAVRKDPKTADIPYILVSSTWGKAEFAKHQKTEFGANAYYGKKNPITELEATIEAVTGFKFSAAGKSGQAQATQGTSDRIVNVKLQAASDVVNIAEEVPDNISMEAPINLFSDGELPQPQRAPAAAPKASTPAKPSGEPTSSMAIEIPSRTLMTKSLPPSAHATKPAAVASSAVTPGGGIDISVASSDFQIETTGKPMDAAKAGSVAPVPPSPPQAAAPGVMVELQLSAQPAAVVADQAAAVAAPAAQPPSFEGLSASAEPTADAAPQPAPQLVVTVESAAPPVSEEEAAMDLPYLFAGSAGMAGGTSTTVSKAPVTSSLPSLVANVEASGGPLSNDVDTLKKYLTMREQDVSVLTAQLSYAKEELSKSENTIKRLTFENEDLFHKIDDFKRRVVEQDQELAHAGKSRDGEVEQLRFEVKAKIDRIKFLDDKLNDSAQQYEKLKERVRLDIRKIRVREKELESKLEILKKDSETLIAARENKILELKRKIDLLEFNYDTLQDKNEMEKQTVLKAHEKIDRVLKVLKLALGVIEAEGEHAEERGQGGAGSDKAA